MEFLFNAWLYLAFGLAGGILALTISKWKETTMTQKLLSFTLVGLVCHMFEERIFPAGFAYIFNIAMGNGMQNQLGVLIGNPMVLILLTILYFKFNNKVQSTILVAFVGIMESALHIFMGITSMQLFETYNFPYSPGLFTSIFFLLPISILAIKEIVKNHKESFSKEKRLKTIGLSFLYLFIMAFGCILLPQILTGSFTQFNYLDNGIYEQFLH